MKPARHRGSSSATLQSATLRGGLVGERLAPPTLTTTTAIRGSISVVGRSGDRRNGDAGASVNSQLSTPSHGASALPPPSAHRFLAPPSAARAFAISGDRSATAAPRTSEASTASSRESRMRALQAHDDRRSAGLTATAAGSSMAAAAGSGDCDDGHVFIDSPLAVPR